MSSSKIAVLNVQRHSIWAVGLIVVVLVAFGNSIPHPFVHDDVVFIQNNPSLNRFNDLREIFIPPARTAGSIVNPYYRPLLEIVYKLEYRLFGLDPHGYHLFNVLLHAVNAFLVYVLFFLITSRIGLSAAVALLFAVHPVQSEAVACVSGISNLVSAFFSLAALILFAAAVRNYQSRDAFKSYALSLVCFALALYSKEQAIATVLLVTLMDLCFPILEDRRLLRRRLRVLGFWLVAAGYLLWRHLVLGTAVTDLSPESTETGLRLLSIPRIVLTYLGTVFFPVDLHYYRSVDILQAAWPAWTSLGLVVATAVVLVNGLERSRRALALFGCLWFFLALLPTLNIVPLVNEYSLVMAAEHFEYLSISGLFLVVLLIGESMLRGIFPSGKRTLAQALMLIVVYLFTILTIQQNMFWRGEVPLFERSVQFEPNFGRGRILLAKAYYFDHRYDRARQEYLEALLIMERYAENARDPRAKNFYLGFIKGIQFDLAHVFEAQGRYSESAASYAQALAIDPGDGVLHNSLGVALMQLGESEHAIAHFREALKLNPRDTKAATNLAMGLMMEGNSKEGLKLLQKIFEPGTAASLPQGNDGKVLRAKEN